MNSTKYRRMIIGYWLLLPVVFFIYLVILAVVQKVSVGTLLTTVPSLTLAFLLSCLLLIQAYLLYRLAGSQQDSQLLVHFLLFSLLQQLITANLIGTVLVCFYWKSLKSEALNSISNRSGVVHYGLMTMVGALSILAAVLTLLPK